ncbi:DUF3105 domain-containing protein [Candidatus Microgenomates bacterium]|nr:MAG: DUF3105 domain-containing protein [Candidatus Microgenomates bacterium]
MRGKEKLNMDYPQSWDELPKYERRQKIKAWQQEQERNRKRVTKMRNWGVIIIIVFVGVFGFTQLIKKSPEQAAFEQQIETVSLDGKVEEFPIEGRDHVAAGTDVNYQTNPPTSGSHLGDAEDWGVYDKEIDDKAGVHGLEHGGIWISYKDIDEEAQKVLEEIGKSNSQSTIVSPRQANDNKIAVVSWGRMMKLDTADEALIQKYIDTYKNESPEKLAR